MDEKYRYGDTDSDLIRRFGKLLKYPTTVRIEIKKNRPGPKADDFHTHWAWKEPSAETKRRIAEAAEGLDPELRYEPGEHRFYGRIEPEED